MTSRADRCFSFTITDAARMLGKSPVTLRSWESKGEIKLPRNGSGDRKFFTEDIRAITTFAFGKERISSRRKRLVEATMTLIEQIERDNR